MFRLGRLRRAGSWAFQRGKGEAEGAAGTGMTGKGIALIRLSPGDYAGAGKGGQQQRKATEASPCFENTVIFRGKPAVGKNMRRGSPVVLIPRCPPGSQGYRK